MSQLKSLAKTWTIRTLSCLAAIYLTILGILILNETRLVYPVSRYPNGNWNPVDFHYDEIKFQSADGTKLVGWHLRLPKASETEGGRSPNRTVLICHGNGENVAQSAQGNGNYFREALQAEVFEFDYRGYGKSEGTPHEAGILQDAEAALACVCDLTSKTPDEIILVGYSIGGGPAVHLAAKCGCKVLVLQRTFSSLSDAAQEQYPWLPVRYLMRNQYPSTQKVKSYQGPVFQSHGDADRLIPIRLAKQLYQAAPSKQKSFVEVKGMTHWDPLPKGYWPKLEAFIRTIEQDGESRGTALIP